MAKYGIPYKGGKSKIADDILKVLPSGKRFVDLFGGGFAMSHAALLSGKYESVLWNDINPLLKPLIEDAVAGKYNYDVFKPEFITRERFFAEKEQNGYIKYIWSFGNNGFDYMFGASVEPFKHSAHDWVVFGIKDERMWNLFGDFEPKGATITERRLELNRYSNAYRKKRFKLEQLERLERLQQLEQLERLQQLELTTMDYREYKHRDGDVVYCDVPYDDCCNKGRYYTGEFDRGAFFEWATKQDYPVYVSYNWLCDKVFEKQKLYTAGSGSGLKLGTECVYLFGKRGDS